MGFERRTTSSLPHVTLARMKHAGGKELVQDVVQNRDPDVGTLSVDEVRLTESVRTDDGPEYSTVASIPL